MEDMAGAASDQADAAQQFSDTAEDINQRMSEAVGMMNSQAKAMKDAASAAKSASDSMADQVGQMQASLHDFEAAQRAVLVVKTYAITDPIEVGKRFRLQCTIMNVGATTALDLGISEGAGKGNVTPWIEYDRWGKPDFEGFNIKLKILVNGVPNPADAGESLGPNTSRDCSKVVGPVDADTLAGKWWQDYTTSVSYRDVFGKAWIINACLVLRPGTGQFSGCQMTTEPNKPN